MIVSWTKKRRRFRSSSFPTPIQTIVARSPLRDARRARPCSGSTRAAARAGISIRARAPSASAVSTSSVPPASVRLVSAHGVTSLACENGWSRRM